MRRSILFSSRHNTRNWCFSLDYPCGACFNRNSASMGRCFGKERGGGFGFAQIGGYYSGCWSNGFTHAIMSRRVGIEV